MYLTIYIILKILNLSKFIRLISKFNTDNFFQNFYTDLYLTCNYKLLYTKNDSETNSVKHYLNNLN